MPRVNEEFSTVEVETQRLVRCPNGCAHTWVVEHLFRNLHHGPTPEFTSAGPWYCDECGQPWSLRVHQDGRVEMARSLYFDEKGVDVERPPKTREVVILEVPADVGPIRFTLDVWNYGNKSFDHTYFYEVHTCPVNWFKDVADVEVRGDTDPHGFAKFVSAHDADTTAEDGATAALPQSVPT